MGRDLPSALHPKTLPWNCHCWSQSGRFQKTTLRERTTGNFRLRAEQERPARRYHHHHCRRPSIGPKREERFLRPGEGQRSNMPLASAKKIQRLTLRCCSKPQPPTKVVAVFFFFAYAENNNILVGQNCTSVVADCVETCCRPATNQGISSPFLPKNREYQCRDE